MIGVPCLGRVFGKKATAIDPIKASPCEEALQRQPEEEGLAMLTADPTQAPEWRAGREVGGAQGASGASINAKVLQRAAPYEMSLLLHAMYGLDQYPQYLLKWRAAGLDEAIDLLERRLEEAREARDALGKRAAYVATYAPLYPELRSRVEPFSPGAAAAVRELAEGTATVARLGALCDLVEETPGVYSFELLSADFCHKLRAELASYARFRDAYVEREGRAPPGTLRERLQLVDAGLDAVEDAIFANLAKPLAKLLFGSSGSRADAVGDVDAPHTFTVGYGPREDAGHNVTRKALIPHVDDSEVTLNVCLSDDFRGGGLRFHGLRSPDKTTIAYELPHPREFDYTHRLGRAVMHLGNHFHEVLDVTSGERHVLIMWLRSWRAYRASHCPCCLKFRREYCICSPEWN